MTAIYKTMPARKERRLKKLLTAVKWVSGISAFVLMVLAYGALGSLETGVLSEAEAYPRIFLELAGAVVCAVVCAVLSSEEV